MTFLRVLSGSMKAGDHAVLARTEADVKIGHIARYQGAHKADIDQGVPGDLVALTKLEEVEVGDTLHAPGHPFHAALAALPKPMVGLTVQPKARGEEAKLAKEIHRLTGGDPRLVADRSRETHELVLRGLSTLHLDIALKRMAHAGVEVTASVPKIPYLTTTSPSRPLGP